jgi:hypothetical protein
MHFSLDKTGADQRRNPNIRNGYTVIDDRSFVAERNQLRNTISSVRTLIEQIQLISREALNVIGDDVVK